MFYFKKSKNPQAIIASLRFNKDITQEQFDKLYHACFYHTKERQSDDATINTCYDADRLDLGRVGMYLNPEKMATAPGAKIARKSLQAKVSVYEMREWLKTIVL